MADGQGSSRRTDVAVADAESVNQGARIHSNYLVRKQEVVSVNRTDLEDIRDFDSSAGSFTTFGVFLLSGSVWLGAEKIFEAHSTEDGFAMTPLLWLCLLCAVVGAFLWHQGTKMAAKKTSRIQRIFDETQETPAENRAIEPPRGNTRNANGAIR